MALLILLLLQGIPALPNQTGTVTGVLRGADGKPAVGVRVSAMVRPDNPQDALGASSMAGISETDEAGRFRLENIPPGRYYIVAGRIDMPTYYPGTQDMAAATIVRITPAGNLPGLDFAMKDSSAGRAYSIDGGGISIASGVTIPLKLRLDDGARFPMFADGRRRSSPILRLQPLGIGASSAFPVTASEIILAPGEFMADVIDLPDDISVKALTYGADDLKTASLKVKPRSFNALTFNGTLTPFSTVASSTPPPGATPVSVTLTRAPMPAATSGGVKVTGHIKDVETRSLYMDGLSGITYSDGTFEFRNVQPGRHTIVTPDHPARAHPFAVSIVVGDRDIDGIELQEASVLPPDIRDVVAPGPSGSQPVGLSLPLAAVRGKVVAEATGEPVSGTATILGLLRAFYPIDDGRFEIPRLLPGNYTLEVSIADHPAVTQPVVVGGDDVQLNIAVR